MVEEMKVEVMELVVTACEKHAANNEVSSTYGNLIIHSYKFYYKLCYARIFPLKLFGKLIKYDYVKPLGSVVMSTDQAVPGSIASSATDFVYFSVLENYSRYVLNGCFCVFNVLCSMFCSVLSLEDIPALYCPWSHN